MQVEYKFSPYTGNKIWNLRQPERYQAYQEEGKDGYSCDGVSDLDCTSSDCSFVVQVKASSEKGWNSVQAYLKKPGQEGEEEGEYGSSGEDGEGEGQGEGQGEEDLMQQDIDDLLGLKGEEPNGEMSGGKRNSRKKAEEPPLISFDDESVATPIPAQAMPEDSPRSRRKAKTGGGYGSTGYGSTGYGSTNSAPPKTKPKVDDWSGDWGEEWSGATTDTSGSKSGGWDDWNTADGWSNVDLKND